MPRDGLAGLVVARIAAARDAPPRRPRRRLHDRPPSASSSPFAQREQHLGEVGLEPRQQHLGLGVAEARVELEHLGALGGEDEAAVEHAAEVDAARRRARARSSRRISTIRAYCCARRRRGPASRRPCRRCWGRCRRRPPACGPARGAIGSTVAPSTNASSEHLRALEELLDDHRVARVAEAAVEALLDRARAPRRSSSATVTPLPAARPSALTTSGAATRLEVGRGGRRGRRTSRRARRGDVRALHEALRERLAALELCALRLRGRRSGCRRRAGRRRALRTSGTSGPMTARSMAFSRANATTAAASLGVERDVGGGTLACGAAVAGRSEDRVDQR